VQLFGPSVGSPCVRFPKSQRDLVRSEYNPFDDEHLRGTVSAGQLQAPRYYAPGWARLRGDD
jgi:hypothetical protein